MLTFLLPLALAGAQPPAETVLAPDSEARWVPFDLTPGNQIRFEATIDGHPARAILDTGLSHSLVTPAFAEQAGLEPGDRQRAAAIGGGVELAWADAGTLAFGGLTRRGGRLGIPQATDQERFGADALIGSDVLGCCAIEIDYDARRFRVLRSGRLPFRGTAAPLAPAPHSGVPLSELRVAGKRLRPMIVDTGDGAWATLTRESWTAIGYRGPVTTTLGWGMGGAIVTDTAILPALALPGLPPFEAEVRVEDRDGFSAMAGAAGRIGNALLMRYHVLLDPRAGRMVLAPRMHPPVPTRSTSGLLLGFGGGALRVLHVMRGSPAAQGGWREGETICSVDGVPVAEAIDRPQLLDWSAESPGRTVRLTLCDGTRRTLTLRRFY